jgi:hypothetical protein
MAQAVRRRRRLLPPEVRMNQLERRFMSCGNLLNHGDILLHQSQKEFNSCDLGGG